MGSWQMGQMRDDVVRRGEGGGVGESGQGLVERGRAEVEGGGVVL